MSEQETAPAPDVAAEIAEIKTVIRDDPQRYGRDTQMQTRLAELAEYRDNPGEAALPSEPDAREKELNDIREIMRTDMNAYNRDPKMQARFAMLLQGPEPAADNYLGIRDFGFARADIMNDPALAPVIDRWGRRADEHVQTYYDRATDLLMGNDIDANSAMEIRDTFGDLDTEQAPAVANWIVDMKRADVEVPVDLEAARGEFLTKDEGVLLQEIWGDAFDQNLRTYVARMRGLRDQMPPEAFGRLMDKYEKLDATAAIAVIEWVVRQ